MEAEKKMPFGVTIAFYILGTCTLLPWNVFITADLFWQYKLRNTTVGQEWTGNGAMLTDLQVSFMPTLVVLSNVLALIFTLVSTAITARIGDKTRIYGSLCLCLFSMVAVTVLSIFNTDTWQYTFYVLIMIFVSLLSVGVPVVQNSLYGIAGTFSSSCITANLSGQAVAGVVSSVAMLISLAIGQQDPVLSGIVYFFMTDVSLIMSLAAYFYLTRTPHYKHFKSSEKSTADATSSLQKLNFKNYISILKNIKWMGFTTGFCLLVTLSIFPAVQVYVSSVLPTSTWTEIYFQPTITFLLFNVFDLIGRETCRFIRWPKSDGWKLHVLAATRVIFIPLIMLCHGSNKNFPTLFYNDVFYIFFNGLFAFSNGYFISLCLIYYPRLVQKSEVELAGTLIGSMLAIGMTIGAALSPATVALWGPRGP